MYAGMEHKPGPRNAFASDRSAVLNGLASTLGFVPGLGDVAGLAADADMYATDPKSRTWLNAGLSLAGMLPFVPSAAARIADWTRGSGNAEHLLHVTDAPNIESILKDGLRPGKTDDYVYLWDEGLDAEAGQIMREARQTRYPNLGYDEVGGIEDGYIAVKREAIKDRLEVDPYTGAVRVRGTIPPSALQHLKE
jgi:hypothetical protein